MSKELLDLLELQKKTLESYRKFIKVGDFSPAFVSDFDKSLCESITEIEAEEARLKDE